MKSVVMAALWFGLAAGAMAQAPPARINTALGEAVYARCQGCHALAQDRTGPHHCALFGRKAGSVPGLAYSEAMRRSKIVWTSASLDRFLKAPMQVVPGTSMGYDGVKDNAERAALIAYLRQAGGSPACAAPH